MGPVGTRSGYGAHTRDLVTSLIQSKKYDIDIVAMPWGNTPNDALTPDNETHAAILQCVVRQNISRQPDVFIHISVANEFQAHGKYNIGITAGVETDAVPPAFIEGANRMNMVITVSEYSKSGFNAVYDKINDQTKQKSGELRLERPIEVLFEGIDTDIYRKIPRKEIHETVDQQLSHVKPDFNFLFVGHWLKGDIGADRKDIGMLIKTFCEAFKNKSEHNRPGLILKTSHATFSIIDRESIMRKVQQITAMYGYKAPKIYLLHGDLTDAEMNSLYNHPKVKAMVSFTHGEGFGRPLLEFTATGKPVIAPDQGGHVDFLKHGHRLPCEKTKIHVSAADEFLQKDTNWFTVNYQYAASVMRDCMDNYKNHLKIATKQKQLTETQYTLQAMSVQFIAMIDKALETVPQQVALQLPKLKKVGSEEPPKLQLPKLKKVEA
jgi:glycosyltransferase involved in cell wall biosynthesis